MLVLLAALTVLLALLLPVLQAAEVSGRELNCLEGLRAAGVGLDVYTQDHDGVLPPVADRSRFSAEVFAHDGYDRRSLLAGYAMLRACPASGAARPDAAGNTAAVLQGTYAWMAPDPAAVSPAEAVRGQDVLIDAQRGRGGFGQRYNHGNGVAATRQGNPAFGGFWGGDPTGVNALYGDGHAAWVGVGDIGVSGWATGQRQRRVYGPARRLADLSQ